MPRHKTAHSPATIEKVLTLRRAGHTKAQIRDVVGLSEDMVAQICAKHRDTLPRPKPGNRTAAPHRSALKMDVVTVFIRKEQVLVTQALRVLKFPTAGRDDLRIQEAVTRCRAAGFPVQVYNTQP